MKKSPIQAKDLRLLTQDRAAQIAQEVGADTLIIVARRGKTVEFQAVNCTERDIIFAAQNLLHELYEDFN